uniref:Exportin-4 n=1 Tax=Timema poppense TaxID=170557 RepID=A0A7R9DA79_TIMPO|nr:unnamed protein product [Timema poppensis]
MSLLGLRASPAVVTVDQRKSAENLFLNFRKTKSPYDLCRHILETSSVDFVQFEAASLLKDALIREWSFLGDSHVISLQQYLLQYIIQKQLPASVRERILQVIAIMVKRASVDDFGISRGHLLAEVEQLILSGDPPRDTHDTPPQVPAPYTPQWHAPHEHLTHWSTPGLTGCEPRTEHTCLSLSVYIEGWCQLRVWNPPLLELKGPRPLQMYLRPPTLSPIIL